MNNNSMPLAIAIAVAFLGSAPHAAAAALGEVTALSAMGESFRAEIRLPGESLQTPNVFVSFPPRVASFPPCARAASPSPASAPTHAWWYATPRVSASRS